MTEVRSRDAIYHEVENLLAEAIGVIAISATYAELAPSLGSALCDCLHGAQHLLNDAQFRLTEMEKMR